MTRFATLLTLLLVPALAFAQKDLGAATSNASGGGPDNDNLEDATVITGDGEYLSTVTGATAESGEAAASCASGDTNQSVWWVFTPAADGAVTLDTDGSVQEPPGTQFTDTILTLYTGGSFPLTEIACNDDDPGNGGGGDFTSRIEDFAVTAGTTYYVRVSSFPATRADGEARLSFTGPALVVTAAEDVPEAQTFALGAASPNPSAGPVALALTVDEPQALDVAVFDVLGRRVLDVYTGTASTDLALVVDTRSLRPGTYVVRAMGSASASVRAFTVAR